MPALLYATSLLLILMSTPVAAAGEEALLFERISARLGLMKAVAADKWLGDRPIEDLQREADVLHKSAYAGLRVGITIDSNNRFYQAQISAAKSIQHYWFNHWREHSGPDKGDSLVEVIRPKLISLGESIATLLKNPVAEAQRQLFLAKTTIEGLDRQHQEAIFDRLLALQYYPDRLTQIRDSGMLRVGTTGDYAPFSESRVAGQYNGIDIDLIHDLANTLEVEVVLVATSWPSLLSDLSNNAFDIAMSGISRTLQRQQHGFLSKPYHTGGKTPIIRCSDQARIKSLSDIDQKGVRIIVNPGGTNERYVDAHIKLAEKVLFADNRTIFEEIVQGRADVMITDAIEVTLQTNRQQGLCPAMPGKTLTYQEKAILLQQDPILLNYVNLWLDLRLADGTVQRTFANHLQANQQP
ncbi:MAG TPA: transporter substrate-binding domain-containing protein [Gammaproteobacteria bacterium]|nr:transporter substrate-binding domain-containing protein [Gammaproteobacteria bacterium]HIK70533.1 transporter substrate-binding domain-containing protein [Pseudomonadales bacterium]